MNKQEFIVENEIFSVYKHDGIFYIDYRTNLEIDIEVAHKLVEEAQKFSNGEETIGIADVSKIKSITKRARDFLCRKENLTHIRACAFIVDNALSRVLATIFLNFNKPHKPFKVFTSKEMARKWLMEYQPLEMNSTSQ